MWKFSKMLRKIYLTRVIRVVLDYQYVRKSKKHKIDDVLLERGVRLLENTGSFFLKLTFELMQVAENLSNEPALRELKKIYISKLEKRKQENLVNFIRNRIDYWELPRACLRILDLEGQEAHLVHAPEKKKKANKHQSCAHVKNNKLLSRYCKIANKIFFSSKPVNQQSVYVFIPPSIFLPNKKYPGFSVYQKQIIELILKYFDDRNIKITPLLQLSLKSPDSIKSEKYISMHTIDDNKHGLHWKEHDLPYRFRFDSLGYAGWSDLARKSLSELRLEEIDQNLADDYFQKKYLELTSGEAESKYFQQPQWDLPQRSNDYIFIPLQLPGDTVQEHAYISIYEMLELIGQFGKNKGITVVVKRHPHCRSPHIRNLLNKLIKNNACVETKASIHMLIQRASAICTINSTVGAEALSYYKPVYTFGHCDYHHATHVIKRFDDFIFLFSENKPKLKREIHRKYVYFYDTENIVDLRNHPEKRINEILSKWSRDTLH